MLNLIVFHILLEPLIVDSQSSIHKVKVHVPSVTSEGEGNIHLVEVWFAKGKGDVVIVGPEDVGVDTLYSARFAKLVIEKILGANITSVDVVISITGIKSGKIEGPSAGLAFALSIMALIMNKELPSDAAITGAINIDGGVEAVGGVLIKLRAAANASIHRFVLPRANVNEEVIKEAKKFNIELIPVSTITEAFEALTHEDVVKYLKPVVPYKIMEIFKEDAYVIYDKACNAMKKLMRIAKERNISIESYKLINNSLKYYDELKKEFQRAIDNQEYYSAASIAYTMYLNLTLTYALISTPKDIKTLDKEYERLNKTIHGMIVKLHEYSLKSIDYITWELLITIASRIDLALELLNSYDKYNETASKALVLSRCRARVETIKLWFDLLDKISKYKSFNITVDEIKDITMKSINIAEQLLDYFKALIEYSSKGYEEYVKQLELKLGEAKEYYSKEDFVMSHAKALDVISTITTSLSYATLSNLNKTSIIKYITLIKYLVGSEIAYLINTGYIPINSIYYYEYSGYGPLSYRIVWLKMADTYATPLLIYLAEKGIKPIKVYEVKASRGEIPSLSKYILVIVTVTLLGFALGYFTAARRQIVKESSRL